MGLYIWRMSSARITRVSLRPERFIFAGNVTKKIRALRLLIDKYAPENMENGYRYAEYAADNVCILCMELSEIIGKSRTSNGQI